MYYLLLFLFFLFQFLDSFYCAKNLFEHFFFLLSSASPVKKKCVKRAAATAAEMSSKNLEGSNLSSSEEGNEKEAQLFNNLKK